MDRIISPIYSCMQRMVLLLLLLFSVFTLQAQHLTNVSCYQDGQKIVIEYHLDKKAAISLFLSINGGLSFSELQRDISGDVGKVGAGNRAIIYEPLRSNERFVEDRIVFKVVADTITRKKNNITYLLHTIPMQPILGASFAINPKGKWYGLYASTTHSPYLASNSAGLTSSWDVSGDNDYNGKDFIAHHSYTIGPMINIINGVKICIGVNYGVNSVMRQTYNAQLVESKFDQGWGLDAGLMFNLSGITLSAGVSSIDEYYYTKFGFGFTTNSDSKIWKKNNITCILHTIPMQPMQPILGASFAINPHDRLYGCYVSTTHSPYLASRSVGNTSSWDDSGDNDYNGKDRVAHHSYSMGMFIGGVLRIYTGVNYGVHSVMRQTNNNQLVQDGIDEGWGFDAGVIYNLCGMTLSGGISSIDDFYYAKAGLGITTNSGDDCNVTCLLHTILEKPILPIKPILGVTLALNPYDKWYGWYAGTTHSPYLVSNSVGHTSSWDARGDNAYNGTEKDAHHSYSTGPMISLWNVIKLYAGINYGVNSEMKQTYNSQLVLHSIEKGWGFDAGMILNLWGVTFSGGISSINDDYYAKVGIGFTTNSW